MDLDINIILKVCIHQLWCLLVNSIGRGEFNKLENLDNLNYFQFGIYRCKISQENDNNNNKLFRFNPKNYYTHTSLEHAKCLGLKIELIIDSQPNF